MATSRVTKIVVHRGIVQRVSQMPVVRTALRTQAALIASRARQIDSSEGGGATIVIVDGVRPSGRAYANVVSDDADGEFGTSRTARRRTLGRAANIGG